MSKETKASLLADEDSPVKGRRKASDKKSGKAGRSGKVGSANGKSGKGAGTTTGGISGGKSAKRPVRSKNDPDGKGSGNR